MLTAPTMTHYVLRTENPDGPTPDELTLIGQQGTVLDQSRRTLLVDLTETCAEDLAAQLPGWSVQPETTYAIPTTRYKLDEE